MTSTAADAKSAIHTPGVTAPKSRATAVRLALVQHGDYRTALDITARDADEPYAGMKASVRATQELVAGLPHLIINLNAPRYREKDVSAELLGLPSPHLPGLPGRLRMRWWAWKIVRQLRRFRPTHVLLRTSGELAEAVLRYCTSAGVQVLCVFANRFANDDSRLGRVDRAVAALVNHPLVHRAGNHLHPATQSMIAAGVLPDKAVAYDFTAARRPAQFAVKEHRAGDPVRLFFAGNMIAAKGLADVMRAVAELRRTGMDVQLTAAGAGADFQSLHQLSLELAPGHIHLPGSLGNAEVFEHMRRATLVCVPSRHEFPEGMPLTLTEALASRTPVVISDHPVFTPTFSDGEGVRFFPAGDPLALAAVIQEVTSDAAMYRRVSVTTEHAFARVECRTMLADLLREWRQTMHVSHSSVS